MAEENFIIRIIMEAQSRVAPVLEATHQQADRLQKKFNETSASATVLGQRLDKLEGNVNKASASLRSINPTLESFGRHLGNVRDKAQDAGRGLDQMVNRLGKVNTALESTAKTVHNLEKRLGGLETKLGVVGAKTAKPKVELQGIDESERKVNALTLQLASWERRAYRAKTDIETAAAMAKVEELRTQLRSLGFGDRAEGLKIQIDADFNDQEARRQIKELLAEAKALSKEDVGIRAVFQMGQFREQYARIESELRILGAQQVDIDVVLDYKSRSTSDRLLTSFEDLGKQASSIFSVTFSEVLTSILTSLVVFIQPLIGSLVALAGALTAVALAAGQAAAGLGGLAVAGIAQALPVVGLLAAALTRVAGVMKAVNLAQTEQDKGARQGAKSAASQAGAHRALANALDGVKQAQERLNDARRKGVRDLNDLILAQRRSNLTSLRSSTALAVGIASGEGDILALQQQADSDRIGARRQSVDTSRGLAGGVEGLPNVVAAKKALDQARQSVQSARESLNTAAGTDGAAADNLATALGKLTDGEKVLFDSVQRFRSLFQKGGPLTSVTDPIILSFADALDQIRRLLTDPEVLKAGVSLAESIGNAIRQFSAFLTTGPMREALRFFTDQAAENLPIVERIFEDFARIFTAIGKAASGPFHDALVAIEGFFDRQADASEGGGLAKFFEDAMKPLGAFVHLFESLVNLFLALMGPGGGAEEGTRGIEGLARVVDKMTENVKENATKVQQFFHDAIDVAGELLSVVGELGKVLFRLFDPDQIKSFADVMRDLVLPAFEAFVKAVGRFVKFIDLIFANPVGKFLFTGLGGFAGSLFVLSGIAAALGKIAGWLKIITGVNLAGSIFGGAAAGGTGAAVAGAAGGASTVAAASAVEAAVLGGSTATFLSRMKARATALAPKIKAAFFGTIAAQVAGSTVGGTAGNVISNVGTGAGIGAAVGSIVPGVGTAIGAGVGAGAGAVVSALQTGGDFNQEAFGKAAAKAIQELNDAIAKGDTTKAKQIAESLRLINKELAPDKREEVKNYLDTLKTSGGALSPLASALDGIRNRFFGDNPIGKQIIDAFKSINLDGGHVLDQVRSTFNDRFKSITDDLGTHGRAAKDAFVTNFAAAATGIKTAMDLGYIAADKGAKDIKRLLEQTLKTVGVENLDFSDVKNILKITGQNLKQFIKSTGYEPPGVTIQPIRKPTTRAIGGWIGNSGERGSDFVPALLGRGEAVLNWAQQRAVNAAMGGRDTLDAIFARTRGMHAGMGDQPGYASGFIPNFVSTGLEQYSQRGSLLVAAIKKAVTDRDSSGVPSGGGELPTGALRDWLTNALKITNHYNLDNLKALTGRAIQESGGDPRAINRWDINAQRGDPSRGLLQTIGSTFESYKLKGYDDIWNPVHNAIAAIRYMFARYGHIVGPGPGGYAKGGVVWGGAQASGGDYLVDQPTLFMAGESGIERATFTPLKGYASGKKPSTDPSDYVESSFNKRLAAQSATIPYLPSLDAAFEQADRVVETVRGMGTKTKVQLAKLGAAFGSIGDVSSGVIANLLTAIANQQTRLKTAIQKRTFRVGDGYQRVTGTAEQQGLEDLGGLQTERLGLQDAQGQNNELLRIAQSRLKKAKPGSKAAGVLEAQINTAKRNAETIAQQLAQNAQELVERNEQMQQEMADAITSTGQRVGAQIDREKRIATILGTDQGGLFSRQIANANDQIAQLSGVLAQANASGNTSLATQLSEQIAELQTSITEIAAQQIQQSIQVVNDAAARKQAGFDLRDRVANLVESAGNASGAFAIRGEALQGRGQVIRDQIGGLQGLLGAAINAGDNADAQKLVDQINELNVVLQENEAAIRENTTATRQSAIDAITKRGGFLTGIFGALGGLVGARGAVTGNVDVGAQRTLIQQTITTLTGTGGGLRQQLFEAFGIDARGASPEQLVELLRNLDYDGIEANFSASQREQFEGLINAIIENATAVETNTDAIAQLNSNNVQQWSTTAWRWFRNAVFNGSGGLLPQYQMPSFDVGGPIMRDGPIYAHAGEYVLTREQTARGGTSQDVFAPVINNEQSTVDMDPETLANVLMFRYRTRPR